MNLFTYVFVRIIEFPLISEAFLLNLFLRLNGERLLCVHAVLPKISSIIFLGPCQIILDLFKKISYKIQFVDHQSNQWF